MLRSRSQSKCLKLLSVLVLACTLQGCMTFISESWLGSHDCNRVYAGTRYFVSGFGHLSEPGALGIMGIFLIDLPFSFALDTLLLPYTIPNSIQECRKEKEENERQQQRILEQSKR